MELVASELFSARVNVVPKPAEFNPNVSATDPRRGRYKSPMDYGAPYGHLCKMVRKHLIGKGEKRKQTSCYLHFYFYLCFSIPRQHHSEVQPGEAPDQHELGREEADQEGAGEVEDLQGQEDGGEEEEEEGGEHQEEAILRYVLLLVLNKKKVVELKK